MPRPRMDAARISSVLPDGTYPEVDAVLATLGDGPPPRSFLGRRASVS
ncbi:MAG: hypothetical protein QOD04_5132 [Pseudonocardiales bacterium]|jgi:hypothetical protein|nr:hypothetical protein [Pseudonocardiales bacterium]MDT7665576.1 hypothetical protein [Pseudonocardiales bacterium]